ncbi:ATP-binding cassette domain-containing protein [bacterium]|nr:ATP-binding cassette domain-containing protein [bacterium]
MLLANGFRMLEPWVLREAINRLEGSIDVHRLLQYAGLLLGVAVAAGFFRYFMRRLIIGASRHVEFDLRQNLFRHLVKLEPAFYDRSRVGDLMTRSTSDIEQVRMVIGPALMYATNTVFGLAFGISLMIAINPQLTLLVGGVVPVMAVVVFYIGKRLHKASRESQEAFSDLSAVSQENLNGIRVVKAFRQEQFQEGRFAESSRTYFDKNMRLVILRGVFFPLIMIIFGLATSGILLLGGYKIIQGTLKLGDFVAFIGYLNILAWPMISLGWVVGLVQRGSASLQRILELFERQPEIEVRDDPIPDGVVHGEVRFDRVTHTYPSAESRALEEVSFHLQPGKSVGIVGRVGSGKSTIISLLARLYEPEGGRIEIGRVNILDWPVARLREEFGFVTQEPLLFSTSIRENITMARPDITDKDIEEALEISRLAQDLPQFPNGLDTEVGERGITLSGGQKQRVSIARAVLMKPHILVLDDALSAVDADTEEAIVKNLKKYMADRSAIVVTHRISTVHDMDEILVLEDGRVIQRGDHATLAAREDGLYAQLLRRQKLARELEDAA